MAREIKFRVWEPKHAIMQYPDVLQIADGKHDKSWGQGYKFSCDSEPDAVLMQYTGLKDKNGKEIYEGDIIEPVDSMSWIGWCSKCAGWQPMYENDGQQCHACDGNYRLDEIETKEIIGNRFENHELLCGN